MYEPHGIVTTCRFLDLWVCSQEGTEEKIPLLPSVEILQRNKGKDHVGYSCPD
jgi:hypothetical protein